MKEHVVYLDPGDDIHSTLDKLSWVKSARVLLVWPDRGDPLATRYELTRTVRYAQNRGIQLGVVSFHPDVRANARLLGIPVFSSLESSSQPWQREPLNQSDALWQAGLPGEKDTAVRGSREAEPAGPAMGRWSRLPAVRVICSVLSAAAVFMLAAFIFPAAVIYVSPEAIPEQREITLNYLPDPGFLTAPGSGDAGLETIPVQRRSGTLVMSDYFLTTGGTNVPERPAEGYAVFSNGGTEAVALPADTRLRRLDGEEYKTMEGALVQPGQTSQPVRIMAVNPGERGNAEEFSVQQVDGQVGLQVSVSNPEPLVGGTSTLVRAVSSDDVRSARQELLERVPGEIAERKAGLVDVNEIVVPGSIVIEDIHTAAEAPEVGAAAEGFEYTLEAEFSYGVVQHSQLRRVGGALLADENDRILVPDSLDAEIFHDHEAWEEVYVSDPAMRILEGSSDVFRGELPEANVLYLQVRFRTVPAISFSEMRKLASGISINYGRSLLQEQYNLSMKPAVDVFPSWLPFFPLVDERIRVQWIWEVSP